jgi:hypothetical protein
VAPCGVVGASGVDSGRWITGFSETRAARDRQRGTSQITFLCETLRLLEKGPSARPFARLGAVQIDGYAPTARWVARPYIGAGFQRMRVCQLKWN